jgi:RNA polymerase sigma-70 factor (ECF subfamily)
MPNRPHLRIIRPESSFDPEDAAQAALERGDPDEALSVLMTAYGKAIFRYCCQVMKDRHLAEEVLQETFVQAFQGFERFAGKSKLRTWLFSIAHNRCLDALRKERTRAKRIQPVSDPPETEDPAVGPEASSAAEELADVLRQCLEKLTPKVRSAVILRFREELTYPEMSEVCGDRAPTLQARVTRAMPVLRECVESLGFEL